MAEPRCRAIYSLLIFCSLITCKARCLRALSSVITPSYNRWSTTLGSTAKFNPTPLRALIVGQLASFSMVNAPSGKVSLERPSLAASQQLLKYRQQCWWTPCQTMMHGSATPVDLSRQPQIVVVATTRIVVVPSQEIAHRVSNVTQIALSKGDWV